MEIQLYFFFIFMSLSLLDLEFCLTAFPIFWLLLHKHATNVNVALYRHSYYGKDYSVADQNSFFPETDI